MTYTDRLREIGIESRCYFISKRKVPDNLKRRIRDFSKFVGITIGPIEVKSFEVSKNYYKASFILHRCIEDETAHSPGYENYIFDRRHYRVA